MNVSVSYAPSTVMLMPRISIKIDPNDPPRTYGPGDEVVGEIVLHDARPGLFGEIKMKLWGGIRLPVARGNLGKDNSRSRHLMFASERTVSDRAVSAQSKPLEAGERRSWPFTISFPRKMSRVPDGGIEDDGLPPSWQGQQHQTGACIEYKLTAVIYKHRSHLALYEGNKLLRFTPELPANYILPDPLDQSCEETFTVRSLKLLPKNQERDLSFREKTKSMFQRDKLPEAAFKFSVTWPGVVVVGSRLYLYAGIEHLPEQNSPANLPSPQVRLLSLTVTLKAYDQVESHGISQPHADTLVGDNNIAWKYIWSDAGAFGKDEGWTKRLSTDLPEHIESTFTTWKIKRMYRVKILAVLTVGDKRCSYEAKPGPFDSSTSMELLPRRASHSRRPSLSPRASASPSRPAVYRSRAGDEEDLPAYEEALLAPAR